MSLDLASELWAELRRYITVVDRADAVDTLVSVLVDNGFVSDEIKSAFKGDSEVKKALAGYFDKTEEDDFEEDEDEEDFEDFENEDWED